MITTLIMLIVAYLLGSISCAILVCKLKGLPDPRTQGSNNAGATNMLRLADKKTAGIVLFGDLLKGLIAVLIARYFGVHGFALGLVALAATLGHIFPVFFDFKGGKGVATGLGVMLGLSWPLALLVFMIWISMTAIYRTSSLSAIAAAASAPIISLIFYPAYFFPLLIISGLLIWKHHENIKRIAAGSEPKIGEKRS